MEESAKKNLKTYGIFFGIIIFMSAVLIASILYARESWQKGLASEVQSVLDSYEDEKFIVDKYVDVGTLASTSAAVYSLIKVGGEQRKSSDSYYGVIIRVPSIVGPVPAVFVCNGNKADDVMFVGYAGDFGKAKGVLEFKNSGGIINYWRSMIPKITAKIEND